MLTLFCADPLARRHPDPVYADEVSSATEAGFATSLLHFEALVYDDVKRAVAAVPRSASLEVAVYRGWMLRPCQYARLYEALLARGVRLINDPDAYAACHLFPNSYAAIAGMTPLSIWLPLEVGELIPSWETLQEVLRRFGERAVIVKDYVKSRKHEWAEACYIPNAADQEAVMRVVRRFVELQGPDLEGGLVFRAFVPFAPIGVHPQSGMPLTEEYRLFWLDGEAITVTPYWETDGDGRQPPSPDTFRAIAASIASRFFTMDVARRADGSGWSIVELGDGQVAGLPARLDMTMFYQTLWERLGA